MGDHHADSGEHRLFRGGHPLSNPDQLSIPAETWVAAEEPTNEILCCIHPTLDSDERRKDVIEYVQGLIRSSVGCEVFPYGSVPLKTYLPDGDIDLTVLSIPTVEDTLPQVVLAILLEEEENENAEYKVTSTQFIDAEVKLVKCLVQNIVVDISFNQLGGLCTLCFLEQVDRLICKDHLFKRSIMLVKAWCYYESRILGAHCGLISTYALETLVLYIFRVFGASLNRPFAVLYRFLDYFSRFDWDNYCISLDGPVCRASLPDIVVEKPEDVRKDLMLSGDFLKNCIEMFGVQSKLIETSRAFAQKNLNIIDPLKENNNLGRSVHRGNFYRIRSAFKFGARKLGQILSLPRDDIADEIKLFFKNTLDIQGRNCGSEVDDSQHTFDSKGFCALSIPSRTNTFSEDDMYSKLSNLDFDDDMSVGVEHKSIMGSTGGSSLLGHHVAANPSSDLATYRLSLRSTNATSDCSQGSSRLSGSQSGLHSWLEQGGNGLVDERVTSSDYAISGQEDVNVLDSLSLDFRERGLVGSVGQLESINPLSNLTGDYESHIRSLLYGQTCHGYALSAPILRSCPTSPSQFQNMRPWETLCQSVPLNENPCNYFVLNGEAEGPLSYYPTQPNAAFRWEERRKVRGTGTYVPIMNGCYRERGSQWRGRNRAPRTNNGHFQRHTRYYDRKEVQSYSEGSYEPSGAQYRSQRRGRFGGPDHATQDIASHDPTEGNPHHPQEGKSDANGSSNPHRRISFGSFEPLPKEASQGPELIFFGKYQEGGCGRVVSPQE